MGGLVTTHFTAQNPGLIDRLILSAPMLDVRGLDGVPMIVLRTLAFVMNAVGKGYDYLPGGCDPISMRVPEVPENETSSCQERLDCWNLTREDNKQVRKDKKKGGRAQFASGELKPS